MQSYLFKKSNRILITWVLIMAMLANLYPPELASADNQQSTLQNQLNSLLKANDTKGHWAEKEITDWTNQGLVHGYEDGSFRPNNIITRVEFVALVNGLFHLTAPGNINFSDVQSKDWFAPQVSAATKAGYIQGYENGTFRPQQPLNRAEAAIILSRLVPLLTKQGSDPLGGYFDQASIPSYSRDAISGAIDSGYFAGFPDKTIRPDKSITRAEAVVLLDRILEKSSSTPGQALAVAPKVLETAGIYGPTNGLITVAGDLTINAPGITLQNLVVKGNLLVGEPVGEGDVYLQNVKVLGNTLVKGGGQNSIHIDNSDLSTIVIEKVGGRVRVVVGGTTVIEQMDIQSDATIESNGSMGIEGIVISQAGEVTLSGKFKNVEINANVQLTITSGAIENIQVSKAVTDSTITLDSGVHVAQMDLHGSSSVKGEGTIDKAQVDSPNVSFEKAPANVETTSSGSTPTPTPVVISPTSPPSTSVPTDPPMISVGTSVNQIMNSGFNFSLDRAVTGGLAAANLTLKDSANSAVSIQSAAPSNGGLNYAILAQLIEGQTYTLTITKAGYTFGTAINIVVPLPTPTAITVSSVFNKTIAGFSLSLSSAVTGGLNAANFTLKDSTNTSVSIQTATSSNGGVAYALSATLIEGETYSLTITKSGYTFQTVSITIPNSTPNNISITSVTYIKTTGFTISLSSAITGDLNESNFTLKDSTNTVISIQSVTPSDGGLTYAVSAALVEDHTYTLTLVKSGYTFETLQITVASTTISVTSVTNTTPTGFKLNLSSALTGDLTSSNLTLTDNSDSATSIPTSVASSNGGLAYTVAANLIAGHSYTLTIVKPGYTFGNAVHITVPDYSVEVTISTVTNVTATGFTFTLSSATAGNLETSNLVLKDSTNAIITINSFTASNGGLTYTVIAPLISGGHYTFDLVKMGYSFVGTRSVTVPEASLTILSPTVNNIAASGFSINLGSKVTGLNTLSFILKDAQENSIPVDMVSPASGSTVTYTVYTQLNEGSTYKVDLDKSGYAFNEPIPVTVPISAKVNNPVTVNWVSHAAFLLTFTDNVSQLSPSDITLLDAANQRILISSVIEKTAGKSFMVQADLFVDSTNSNPLYTFTMKLPNNRISSGEFHVSNSLAVTTQVNAVTAAKFKLNLNIPITDLTYGKMALISNAGQAISSIVSISTLDQGNSYLVTTSGLESNKSYTLTITNQTGYAIASSTFNSPIIIPDPTVQLWGNDGIMIGLNPEIHGMTAANFTITNTVGDNVPILSYNWDAGQHLNVVHFAKIGLQYYTVTINYPGYDFGTPKVVDSTSPYRAFNEIVNVTSSSFRLTMSPRLLYKGSDFVLKNSNGAIVPISSVVVNNEGDSYDFEADLSAGGKYSLSITSAPNTQIPVINVPIETQLSIDSLSKTAFTVVLSKPIDGLQSNNFSITNSNYNYYLLDSVTTTDNGKTYKVNFSYPLPVGDYHFEINGNSSGNYPINSGLGIALHILAPVDVTLPTFSAVTTTGFSVTFPHAVTGLLSANILITDSANKLVPNGAITTTDYTTYHIAAALEKGKDYKVIFNKDFYNFDAFNSFHVNDDLTANVDKVTSNGFILYLSPAVPGLSPTNVIIKNSQGQTFTPGMMSSSDGGKSYPIDLSNIDILGWGNSYTLSIDKPGFTLAPFDFTTPYVMAVASNSATGIVINFSPALAGLTKDNFAIVDESGSSLTISSAVSSDGGNYTVAAAMPSAKIYSITYRPSVAYQSYSPIQVVVAKTITATVTGATIHGLTLHLSEPVADLKPKDLILLDSHNTRMPFNTYTLTTSDSGLTYQVGYTLSFADRYTLDLARDNNGYAQVKYVLAAPVVVDIPTPVAVNVVNNNNAEIALTIYPVVALTESDIQLKNAAGQPVSFTLSTDSAAPGLFRIAAPILEATTYSLSITHAGFDFGPAIAIARDLHVDTSYFNQTQKGFLLRLNPAVPDLKSAQITITAAGGQIVNVTSLTTTDFGKSYSVSAPLSSGKIYSVAFSKPNYTLSPLTGINLIANGVTINNLSTKGFRVNLNKAIAIGSIDVQISKPNGDTIQVQTIYSPDGGLSYEVGATLTAGVAYTVQVENLSINSGSSGDDFGADTRIQINSVDVTFDGMANHSANQIILLLSPPLKGLTAKDFQIKAPYGNVSVLDATYTGNGSTYIMTASFIGNVNYTVLPIKDGYDFGAAVPLTVPVGVLKNILQIGAKSLVVGLNPAVPNLTAASFVLTDSQGNDLPATSAITEDNGATYKVSAAFTGQTYRVQVEKLNYDFGAEATAIVPSGVTTSIVSSSLSGLVVAFNPALPGLTAANFSLANNSASTDITSITTTDGGASYTVAAELVGGKTYKLANTLAGFVIAAVTVADASFLVDIPVVKAVSQFSGTGLTLKLNPAVPASILKAADLILRNEQGTQVAVNSIITNDGGATYTVNAPLQESKIYSLDIPKSGYLFGVTSSFLVPIKVTKSVNYLMDQGFTLHLSPAVPDLTVSEVSLLSGTAHIAITSFTTTDNGATYKVGAKLQPGSAYNLNILKTGYEFGAPVTLNVEATFTMSIITLTDNQFYIQFDQPTSLATSTITLHDETMGVDHSFETGPQYEGILNYIPHYKLVRGNLYTLEITDPNHPFSAPIDAILPTVVSSQVTAPSAAGFTLTLGQGFAALQADDVSLFTTSGQAIDRFSLTNGDTAGVYKLEADLVEGNSYTLKLHKRGYSFGDDITVLVPIIVRASVTNLTSSGFTLALEPNVPNLGMALKQGSQVIPTIATTVDTGYTYKVSANLGVNTEFVLTLTKAGYSLGTPLTVNNTIAAPKLISAVTSETGNSVILSFDKPFNPFVNNTNFAISSNGSWLHNPQATIGSNDPTQIIITLGAYTFIGKADTAIVTYTGVNSIKAKDNTYLAAFGEVPIMVVSSAIGYAKSKVNYDSELVLTNLRDSFKLTALEAATIMSNAGNRVSVYVPSLASVYGLRTPEGQRQLAQIFYDMDADALTALSAVGGLVTQTNLNNLIAAGYDPSSFVGPMQRQNYQTLPIASALKAAGVSNPIITQLLANIIHDSASQTMVTLRSIGVPINECITLLTSVYGSTESDVVLAMKAANISAANATAAIAANYSSSADVKSVTQMLYQSGYSAKDIGPAIAAKFNLSNAVSLVLALQNAGFNEADIYAAAGNVYAHIDVAVAMLRSNISSGNMISAVQASGETGAAAVSVIANAFKQTGLSIQELENAFQSNGYSVQEAISGVLTAGFGINEAAIVINQAYKLDLASAYTILSAKFYNGYYAGYGFSGTATIFSAMVQAGYDSKLVANYYLQNVRSGNKLNVILELKLSGVSTDNALRIVHDFAPITIASAFSIFIDYGAIGQFTSDEVLSAVLYAFADDPNVTLNVQTVGLEFYKIKPYTWQDGYYTRAQQLKTRMGMTMLQWMVLEQSDSRVRGTGTNPRVEQIMADTLSLYWSNTITIQDVVNAMSVDPGHFPLADVISGLAIYFKEKNFGTAYLKGILALLKNSGFPMQDIIASIQTTYGNAWVSRANDYGLTASDVAVYYKKLQMPAAEVIDKLSPYSLQEIISALRTDYNMTSSGDVLALLSAKSSDIVAISQAIGYVYREPEKDTYVKLLKLQGAEAGQVIGYLQDHGVTRVEDTPGYLAKAGYTKDEVFKAVLQRFDGWVPMSTIVGALGSVYGLGEVNIGALLAGANITNASDAIEYMASHNNYTLADEVNMLKTVYNKTAGETTAILAKRFAPNPYSLNDILTKVSIAYSGTQLNTILDTLAFSGVTTPTAAIAKLYGYRYSLNLIVQTLKNGYGQEAGAATELLLGNGHFNSGDIAVEIASVYYAGESAGYLADVLKNSGNFGTPYAAIHYLYDTYFRGDASESLATVLKVIYSMDAVTAIEFLGHNTRYTTDTILRSVQRVYGTDPLFAYLSSLKQSGRDANYLGGTLKELNRLTNDSNFMVNSFIALGFDGPSIMKTRLYYYHADNGAEIGAQLAKLGFTDPTAIAKLMKENSWNGSGNINVIIEAERAALPNKTLGEIAFGIKATGYYDKQGIINGLIYVHDYKGVAFDDSIATQLKVLGFDASEAATILNRVRFTMKDSIFRLKNAGYDLKDFIKKVSPAGNNEPPLVNTLKQLGYSANEIAKAMWQANFNYFEIYSKLDAAGFSDLPTLVTAYYQSGVPILWVVKDIYSYGNYSRWRLADIAKQLLLNSPISLNDLTTSINMANKNDYKSTFAIIREISTREQDAFLNKIDNNDEKNAVREYIPNMITLATFYGNGRSAHEAANALAYGGGVTDYTTAVILMFLGGYGVGDILSAVWDVYRTSIGIDILLAMFNNQAEKYIANYKTYKKLIELSYKLIKYGLNSYNS